VADFPTSVNSGNPQKTLFCYNGIVEVTGSIPVGSTKSMKGLADNEAKPFSVAEAPRKNGDGIRLTPR
jgi:hypothetical protein